MTSDFGATKRHAPRAADLAPGSQSERPLGPGAERWNRLGFFQREMRVHSFVKIIQRGDEALRSVGSVARNSIAVHLLPDVREARRKRFVLSHKQFDYCRERRLGAE